jgi:hypothetical protein
MRKYLILFGLTGVCLFTKSQNRVNDSILFFKLIEKANNFNEQKTDSCIFLIKKSISFAEEKKLIYNKTYSLGFYGTVVEATGDVVKADSLYNEAIRNAKQNSFFDLLSANYLNLGIL